MADPELPIGRLMREYSGELDLHSLEDLSLQDKPPKPKNVAKEVYFGPPPPIASLRGLLSPRPSLSPNKKLSMLLFRRSLSWKMMDTPHRIDIYSFSHDFINSCLNHASFVHLSPCASIPIRLLLIALALLCFTCLLAACNEHNKHFCFSIYDLRRSVFVSQSWKQCF